MGQGSLDAAQVTQGGPWRTPRSRRPSSCRRRAIARRVYVAARRARGARRRAVGGRRRPVGAAARVGGDAAHVAAARGDRRSRWSARGASTIARRPSPRAARSLWAFAAALRRGAERPVLRPRRGDRAHSRSPSCFARAIARRGVFEGDPDGRDHRRRDRRAARDLHLLPGRARRSSRRVFDAQGRFAPQLAVAAAADRRHLGPGLPRRRHALRRGDQFGAARDDRRHAVDADRPRASRWSCSAAAALCRRAEADVDPADRHAAVRDRAGAGRAVRPHRPRHRLARRVVRHRALALALRAAGRRRSRSCSRSRRSRS